MNGYEFLAIAVMWGIGSGHGVAGLVVAGICTFSMFLIAALRDREDTNNEYFDDEDDVVEVEAIVDFNDLEPTIGEEFPDTAVMGQVHFLVVKDTDVPTEVKVLVYVFDGESWEYKYLSFNQA